MIRELRLQNFKCFSDERIPFSALTLLAGANASGKSTTIQALLLLRQSQLHGALSRGELLLNSNLASIGTASDVLNQRAENDEIAFTLTDFDGRSARFAFLYKTAEKDFYLLRAEQPPVYEPSDSLFAPQFNYLNAERVGPRLLYPMAELRDDDSYVGVNGQYAAHVLARHRDEDIACASLAWRDVAAREVSLKLEAQVRYWMRTVVPEFEVQLEELISADQVRVTLKTSSLNPVRPTNIGFGIIYTLPIIIAALVAPQGSLLIVENPEAHLHPAGQSRMGQFLARVAAAGVQVVIETHSDHVLNGIRRAVRSRVLGPDLVAINFLGAAGKLTTPRIYPDGGIDPWPEGFFDQSEKDLMELF
jgi:predicted ATPase